MLENRAVVPAGLNHVLRRRRLSESERLWAAGTFRVDVDHKLLDAWLLALCTSGADTAKPTVVEQLAVRLHTARGAGPAAGRLRSDSRAPRGSGRALPHAYRLALGRTAARRHRRTGLL